MDFLFKWLLQDGLLRERVTAVSTFITDERPQGK